MRDPVTSCSPAASDTPSNGGFQRPRPDPSLGTLTAGSLGRTHRHQTPHLHTRGANRTEKPPLGYIDQQSRSGDAQTRRYRIPVWDGFARCGGPRCGSRVHVRSVRAWRPLRVDPPVGGVLRKCRRDRGWPGSVADRYPGREEPIRVSHVARVSGPDTATDPAGGSGIGDPSAGSSSTSPVSADHR